MLSFLVVFLAFFETGIATNNVITAVADLIEDPSERYHKVHNLVLDPDQHSWCELKHIRQIVTHAHCTSKEMENYVCVGTCFSYSVPQTEPETPGDELLDYCDSCKPAQSHWSMVVLECEEDGLKYQVTKNIQMITNCSCSACNTIRTPPTVQDNEVIPKNDHRISELFYKMLPESHQNTVPEVKDDRAVDLKDDNRYSKMSLGELKAEFNLNPAQEQLLSGKMLIKDVASFVDTEDEETERA